MKRDDIINLMQQACDPDKKPAWHNGFWTITQLELDLFVDLVLKAERKPLNEEPVAWSYELATTMLEHGYDNWTRCITQHKPTVPEGAIRSLTPLYTFSPQRQPLTDEEIDKCWYQSGGFTKNTGFARAIERAHGIGGEE